MLSDLKLEGNQQNSKSSFLRQRQIVCPPEKFWANRLELKFPKRQLDFEKALNFFESKKSVELEENLEEIWEEISRPFDPLDNCGLGSAGPLDGTSTVTLKLVSLTEKSILTKSSSYSLSKYNNLTKIR